MKLIRFACATIAIFCAVFSNSLSAQTQTKPAFEVASVKSLGSVMALTEEIQSGKRSIASVRTTIDGARVDLGAAVMFELIMQAYHLKRPQIAGPDWLFSQAYEIHAKLPEGASKDQIPEMLQSLLAERFKFVAHKETKEQPVYALVVSKNGPKLKESIADSEAPAPATDPAKTPPAKDNGKGATISSDTLEGKIEIKQVDRGMVLTGGRTGEARISFGENGAMSMEYSKMKMSDLAEMLSTLTDRPVLDLTDLKGSYQVALEIPMEEMVSIARKMMPDLPIPGGGGAITGAAPGGGGPAASDPTGGSIFQAVQKLGLKLDPRNAPYETLVIDKLEKIPTED
jgi:uncharacterized protein (TIGR03435 family)